MEGQTDVGGEIFERKTIKVAKMKAAYDIRTEAVLVGDNRRLDRTLNQRKTPPFTYQVDHYEAAIGGSVLPLIQ